MKFHKKRFRVKMFIRLFFLLCMLTFNAEAKDMNEVKKDEIYTAQERAWIKAQKVIRVGVEKDWAPFDYIDDNGVHKGISQDYLDEVAQISGLKFSLHPNSWSNLIDQIKSKQIDLLPALYYSDPRSEYIEFSNKYLKLAEYLFTLKETKKITSPSEAYGRTIAVVKGFEVHDWLKKRHPRVKVVVKDTLLQCLQALSSGEVFGFIGDLPSTQYLQEKYFFTNIKINTIISDRDPVSLYMGVSKDKKILATIISKAFDNIPKVKKEKIFSKYANEQKETTGLRGAYGFGRPPYMYDKSSGKGIEEALVRQALQARGLVVSEVRQMPIKRGQGVLLDNAELDFSVGVNENKTDGLYYSDNFIQYENVAITRKSDGLVINSIADLKTKKVLAWSKAYEMLGDEFFKRYNPQNNPHNYTEMFDQKLQHKSFFQGEGDVILVDKNIFQWYVNQYKDKYKADQEYEMHYIFSEPTWIKVSFRSKRLRDEFNFGLREIKKNGKYDEIVKDFLQINIQKQLDLTSLMASLSGKYIFENNIKDLKKILNKFENIKIIKGFEVFRKNVANSFIKLERKENIFTEVKAFTWTDAEAAVLNKPSFYYEEGSTLEVGEVKIYFEIENAKDVDISYIPSLDTFKDMDHEEFNYINAVYKRLNLSSELTKLSIEEQKWIQEHPTIRFVGDPNWLPFEAFSKEGKYVGIVAEYLTEVEHLTGLKFERVQTKNWDESVGLMKEKKVDIISETTDSEMSSFLNFTQPYLENHIVIVMDSNEKYVDNLSQIQDKKIVVIKGYGYLAKIKKAYKGITFMEVENINEGLRAVSSGRADALLCTMALGSYHITKDGFVNLRIVGKTEFFTTIGYGIQPELEPLVGILNKTIVKLNDGKKQEILKKWIAQKYVEKIDYTLVWQIVGAALILLGLFWYWNRQMKKEIGRRKIAEEQLQEVHDQVHKSIEFSSMIQRALMPDENSFKNFFSQYFMIWKPRDTVGGDIYFFETLRHKNEAILMVVDCTGHGVPGAFVTMLVKAIERNITGYIKKSDEMVSPAKLLGILNRSMKHLLKQHDKSAESNAGFDAGILYINKDAKVLRYAGAEIALYYTQDEAIKVIKGDRESVGYRTSKADYVFKDHEIEYEEGMSLYITTDGYIDQNGGAKGFPFGKKRFKEILEDNQDTSMADIDAALLKNLALYQGEYEANDDITIAGVKL